MKRACWLSMAVVVVALGRVAPSAAQETNIVRAVPREAGSADTRRLIVKLRASEDAGRARPLAVEDRVATLMTRAGVSSRGSRRLGASLHVVQIDSDRPMEELARLRADPEVEYADFDRRRYAYALPNDALYSQQWYWQASGATPSATNAEQAWDVTTGSAGVVVAVLDTGVRFDHPDLQHAGLGGRLLPGYDFVADAASGNDGDGRDGDPSDPGDYITQTDAGTNHFSGCDVTNSSWHGTRVAGLVGARTNNAEGMAGGTWSAWVLPVRVLGKCGGFDSDILAGMLWAAGVHVDGVPDNPYPARVENLSLGSSGACPQVYTDVIAEVGARGTLVVVAAGNEGGPVDVPANCPGAVAVAGLRHAGTKVGYSSLGPEVALSAPAGNCVNPTGACLFAINTTVNFGTSSPGGNGYTDALNYNVGTSFSAPIVAAIGGLMLAANANLSPAQLKARLREGATKPFPVSSDPMVPTCHVPAGPGDLQGSECTCTTDTCGVGMANAYGSVLAASRPIAAVATPASVSPGQNVQLTAAGSAAACSRSVVSYAWSSSNPSSNPIRQTGDPATVVVVAPASGSYTVSVTVTDDAGMTDTADVVVSSSAATSAAPASAGTNACAAAIAAPAVPVFVSVSPTSASVKAGETQTFVASVTNSSNVAVTWFVDGVAGGNATLGTISTAGLYTAPASVSSAKTVVVKAAWAGDPSRFGTADVALTASPAPLSSSGGGGGGLLLELMALAAAMLWRRRSS